MRVAIVAMGPTNRVWFDKVYNKVTREDFYQKSFDTLTKSIHENELPVDDECLHMIVQLSKKIGDTADIEVEYDQVWVINGMAGVLRKYDKVFHMDDLSLAKTLPDDLPKRMPVITSAHHPDYKSVEFPIQETVDTFGSLYLNNSVVYAFVYALLQKANHIGLFGCDFNPHDGTDALKCDAGASCMEYWISKAEAMGITVEIPKGCRLMGMDGDKRLYGYKQQPDIRIGDSRMIFKQGWKIEHSPIIRNDQQDQGKKTPKVHLEAVRSSKASE
jgi:hypothetical protein